jgi:hypothetical protein
MTDAEKPDNPVFLQQSTTEINTKNAILDLPPTADYTMATLVLKHQPS